MKESLKSNPPLQGLPLQSDTRNVVDKYKGVPNDAIVADLSKSRTGLHVAIENLEHDFNIGSIIRTANAFNVSAVHIIGKKHYNRRGAMCTDKYLAMHHWDTAANFIKFCEGEGLEIFAVDNVAGAEPLNFIKFPKRCVLVFGAEGPGLSSEVLAAASKVVAIEQLGSTRSINVGAAAGIAMYSYLQQNVLSA
ncbi:MAG: RNA methyltransferase [Candidatus Nomurabacteria bacterium]|nr:RNA methyltransferase [Candidatus Nomurabacteria bacterium]